MNWRRARSIAPWIICLLAAVWIVVHAHYVTDLSAFLPSAPTPMQRLLVEQLRDGPSSRLILIALEDGDAATRASISSDVAARLRLDTEFSSVENGELQSFAPDREFLFQHRYVLSDAVTEQHFTAPGLRTALEATIDDLASSTGMMMKALVPHDPTGEMLRIVDRLAHARGPRTEDGVWVSSDGRRTLLVAQTVAPGSDTDAQEHALAAIRDAFAASHHHPRTASIRLNLSGPGVFAVAARAKIKTAATRLSLISSVLVVCVLLAVYRSMTALVLGLLPVASGALAGIAAVALGFGSVHGITLIGESVDYSIYFFISASQNWKRLIWPTIRLGMLTSVCGFATLLPSGFPGLAQLGSYSISGLIAAALVTRFVLPELLPVGFAVRDATWLGSMLVRLRESWRGHTRTIAAAATAIACLSLAVLYQHRDSVWNHELSALSPVPAEQLRYDAMLRADLGAADVLDIVIVQGPTRDAALAGAERVGTSLQTLIDAGVIGDFDSPADYLPSVALQRVRRDALPAGGVLKNRLQAALAGLDLKERELQPFIDDVDAARQAPLIDAQDLRGTSFATGLNALMLQRSHGWSALLPLHAAQSNGTAPAVDVARVAAALRAANLHEATVLDLKGQTDTLYADYLHEAMRLSAAGLALIVLLLLVALRSPRRAARVLGPLLLAVLTVAALLVDHDVQLTLLHLVGMLLIVAVGSNYALFFDQEGTPGHAANSSLTLASLCVANLSTVLGFGLLSFSQVPVLEALGMTVAPGAFLALLFSALMTSRAPVCAAP